MTKEDIELVIKWFANIEQLATDRKNANGIVMDTTAVLTTIRTKAKDCKEYVQRFGREQEQPKLPGYNKTLLEVKSKVDELYEETSIGLCEYDAGLYNGIADTCMKLRGFIKARLDSDEQPKVDLEKEVKRWKDEHAIVGMDVLWLDFARHFYKLGLSARKDDNQ